MPRLLGGHRVRVGELFAGVGGFRLALEPLGFSFAWANQWEPKAKHQHAADLYRRHFGDVVNEDVRNVDPASLAPIDLLVGGFPCQNYSAAVPLPNSLGIQGEKGVLWWEVARFLAAKRPRYALLENVDRVLLSPAHHRGHDFGLILDSLARLGYAAEWRVVNAADYGFPQKRRRVFILAERDGSGASGVLDAAFPAKPDRERFGKLPVEMGGFGFPFENAGALLPGRVLVTYRADPVSLERAATLGEVLERGIGGRYLIPAEKVERWRYLKGAKDEPRVSKGNGHAYRYKEGALPFPDPWGRPSRTLMTREGASGPSRTSHVVQDPENGRLRLLTPREAERLMGFPDDWTAGVPEPFRYFAMGNAVVVGVVRRIGEALLKAGASS